MSISAAPGVAVEGDYYLNCIRDCDRQIESILDELEEQGFADDTVVILTSDHGELGGAHGMSGKGATAFREQNNVPLVIRHPDLPGGTTCDAVTAHIDLVPTILGCVDDDADTSDLPGHDIASTLAGGGPIGLNDIRDGAVYAFSMFLFLDSDFATAMAAHHAAGTKSETPVVPDFSKRGAIRSVFDGRHRFTRYFSIKDHHRPETMDELLARNDLELFDLEADPDEANNLAVEPAANEADILRMSSLLNRLLDEEVGTDDGSFLPSGEDSFWHVERWDA